MRKKDIEPHDCMDCAHAHLTQRGDNPIIAHCSARKERMVARAAHVCKFYTKGGNGGIDKTY